MSKIIEIQTGCPSDLSGRTDRETAVYELLDTLGIEYLRVDHERADTMEDCAEIDATLGAEICKNLFLCNRQKTEFYLLLMPGNKSFKTKELSSQLGISRLSFAGADDMEKYLGVTPGSATVLGLMNDSEHKVTLLVDEDILRSDFIGCHPCINTSSLKIATRDITEKFLSKTGHFVTPVKLIGE